MFAPPLSVPNDSSGAVHDGPPKRMVRGVDKATILPHGTINLPAIAKVSSDHDESNRGWAGVNVVLVLCLSEIRGRPITGFRSQLPSSWPLAPGDLASGGVFGLKLTAPELRA